jgi:hypothetical protein
MMWIATIRFNDDCSEVGGMLFSDDCGSDNPDIFFFVNGAHDLEAFKESGGMEDFVVLDYEELTKHEEQYL